MGPFRRMVALGLLAGLASAVGCTSFMDASKPIVGRAQDSTQTALSPAYPAPPANLEAGKGPLAESSPAPAATDAPLSINLASALHLAGARPLDVQIAGQQIEAAAAVYDRAKLLWVPNLAVGVDYFGHTGPQQDFPGNIIKADRSSFMAGFGPNVVFAFSDAVYAPLAARQDLRARQAGQQATINDVSLAVAEAYFDVQQARGELAGALLAVKQAEDLVKRITELGSGLAAPQEEGRAKVELARRKQVAITARERWRIASAELARLLRLDPAAVVEPLEPPFLPVTVIDPTVTVDGLIPIALTTRPELAGHQALVEATLARLKQEQLRPLVPSLAIRSVSTNPSGTLGYGVFGGGRNNDLRDFAGRFDIDMQLLWEFQAFGLANRARMNERKAEHTAAMLELFRTQDVIAAEVVRAFAQVRAAAERLNEAEPALRDAVELMNRSVEGLGLTRKVGESAVLIVRPQEAVAAVQTFAQANTDFYAAVGDYNRAQFRLYRALGHPAQCLASSVPGADAKLSFPEPLPKPAIPEAPSPMPAQPAPSPLVPPVVEELPRTDAGGTGGLPARVVPPRVDEPPVPPRERTIPAPTGGAIPGLAGPRVLPVLAPRESIGGTRLAPSSPVVLVPPAIERADPMLPADDRPR